MTEQDQAFANKAAYEIIESPKLGWKDAYQTALQSVKKNIPLVLYGPPGTGKTRLINELSHELRRDGILGKEEQVQFHKKFSYEDFIEGHVPSENGGFERRNGIFKEFCLSPSNKQVDLFVIDEMNRAEISSTFGEVLFAIEDRDHRIVKTAHFGDPFSVPKNLSLIGTMNTADRNIAIIDYAIRRRFRFVIVYPDSKELASWINRLGLEFPDFDTVDYIGMFETINERIRKHPLLGSHMQLGQSLFVPSSTGPISKEDMVHNVTEALLPQVEAYFGLGNENEMSSIFNPSIVRKYHDQERVLFSDLVAMVNESKNEQ